jgi:hypothetical protein
MNTQHAKSLCCKAKIYRFGARRRQCQCCKRTWSIRRKKRGRPSIRFPLRRFAQVFLERKTLCQLTHRSPLALATLRYRFRQGLRQWVARPYPHAIPSGPLILLADALWFRFKGKLWILYLTALRTRSNSTALFLDPVLMPGKEGAWKWQEVFNKLPPQAKIRAVVVDNLNGMIKIANQHDWILQLCHFHLLMKFEGRHQRRLIGGHLRHELFRLVRQVLELPEGNHLQHCIKRLSGFTRHPGLSPRIQGMTRWLIQTLEYHRSYRSYPMLHLPTTNNAVESMAGLIRDLLRRNRCASSPQSLLLWAKAFIRMRPRIVCNGSSFNRFI